METGQQYSVSTSVGYWKEVSQPKNGMAKMVGFFSKTCWRNSKFHSKSLRELQKVIEKKNYREIFDYSPQKEENERKILVFAF